MGLFSAIYFVIFLIIIIVICRFLYHKSDFIKFFSTGLDSGFKIKEIYLLYQAASFANVPEPLALFLSVPALNNCIAYIIKDAQDRNIENDPKIIRFLEKLYKYRTKVELESKKSSSMKTTKSLNPGQRLRVVLKGFGVFASKVLSVGRDLIISLPVQKKSVIVSSSEWLGKDISVYLQRPGDAGYVFDSHVLDIGSFNGNTVLILPHTEELIRSQKRRSVRCSCNIIGQLYLVNSETMSQTEVETSNGLKCLIEDVSEDGALIRIGGKGQKNIKIKVQFLLGENYIVMFGVVRAVEFNAKTNQSRLHFECVTLPQKMKNEILTYVYNVIPQEQKDAFDAIIQAENDIAEEKQEENVSQNNVEETVETVETGEKVSEEKEQKKLDTEINKQEINQTEMFEEFLKNN